MDVEIEAAVRGAVADAARQSTRFDPKRLDELGWQELLEADVESAVRAFLDEQGRLVLSSSAVDSVIIAAVEDPRWSWPDTAVLYPLPGRGSVDGVSGVVLNADASQFLVPTQHDGRWKITLAQREDVELAPVEGIDPTLALHVASVDPARAAETVVSPEEAAAAIAAGRRALAHELIGLSSRMLEIAVAHVAVREQFGKPLGVNQAIQHRLADVKVLIEAATAMADEAWTTCTPFAALIAKAQASRAFDLIAAHGQQVLGAIGYTWEHEWRKYVRRGFFLTVLLGAADELEREIGRTLIEDGVPRVGELVRSDGQ